MEKGSKKPLYKQLYWSIKRAILLKEIPEGGRLPTIEEMHDIYGVSQGTVLKALDLLHKEGVINKKRKTGIHVQSGVDLPIWMPEDSAVVDFDKIDGRAGQRRMSLLSSGLVEAPARIRSIIGEDKKCYNNGKIQCLSVLQIHNANPRDRNRTDFYIPIWVWEKLPQKPDLRLPLLREMNSINKDLKSKGFRQEFRPWILDQETAEHLALPEDTPVFLRRNCFINRDNDVIFVSESITTRNVFLRDVTFRYPPEDGF